MKFLFFLIAVVALVAPCRSAAPEWEFKNKTVGQFIADCPATFGKKPIAPMSADSRAASVCSGTFFSLMGYLESVGVSCPSKSNHASAELGADAVKFYGIFLRQVKKSAAKNPDSNLISETFMPFQKMWPCK